MAAGDFTASVRKAILLREEEIWANPRDRIEYEPIADTIIDIIGNQTANVAVIEGTNMRDNNAVEVTWLNTQVIDTTQAYSASCSPSGTEIESDSDSYDLLIKREAEPFAVKTFVDLRDNTFEAVDLIARGLLRQRKLLDDYINEQIITKLGTFSGINLLPAGAFTGVDPTDVTNPAITYIAAAQWDESLFAKFLTMAKFNRFGNPKFYHGFNYVLEWHDYEFDRLNDNEKDLYEKYNLFSHKHDEIAFNSLSLDDVSFMVDANALAFASKTYYTPNPMDLKADKRGFTMPSMSIPGLMYDVTVTTTCDASGEVEEYIDTYQMRVKCDLFLNPVHVANNTGVLQINKGVRP